MITQAQISDERWNTDHLGTPIMLTDSNQQVAWDATYEPFGKATITTASITNNLRFPGQYYDAETGLHYNWHRYYWPEVGRYVEADPILKPLIVKYIQGRKSNPIWTVPFMLNEPQHLNNYNYTNNNPLNFIDPAGLGRCEDSLDSCMSEATKDDAKCLQSVIIEK